MALHVADVHVNASSILLCFLMDYALVCADLTKATLPAQDCAEHEAIADAGSGLLQRPFHASRVCFLGGARLLSEMFFDVRSVAPKFTM